MVSWFLLLCVGLMVVILLIVNVYMLVHWSHPDDKNEAYFPKALVVRAQEGVSWSGRPISCRGQMLGCPRFHPPASYVYALLLFSGASFFLRLLVYARKPSIACRCHYPFVCHLPSSLPHLSPLSPTPPPYPKTRSSASSSPKPAC